MEAVNLDASSDEDGDFECESPIPKTKGKQAGARLREAPTDALMALVNEMKDGLTRRYHN